MNTRVLTLLAWTLWAGAAAGQVGMPEVVITPVARQGDPVPGIPGAVFDYFLPPHIDAAGNVLFLADLAGPGIDSSNYVAIFYGPPGALQLIAWMSQPAPDMGGEVIMESLVFADTRLSENGWIAFTADLAGPGIVEGLNDMATFVGPPGDIRKVLQGGDQAPGLDPGIIIDVSGARRLGTFLSDNATFRVVAYLAGPGVDATNDRAYWTGTRDDLQLVWREGMLAPGTEPGVTFAWADFMRFNDAGQVAFRGGLAGEGVDETNDTGRWLGGPGALELVTRAGDPAPGFPPGVILAGAGGGLTSTNNHGDANELTLLEGPGITEDNDMILYAGPPGELEVVAREGDLAPEAGLDVEIAGIGNNFLNTRRELFYAVRFRGPSIDDSNDRALYLGPYEEPEMVLRDGDPAPQFPPPITIDRTGAAPALTAGNDIGDWVTVTEIAGAGITEEDKVVLWWHDYLRGEWCPLLRGAEEIDGRIVSIPSTDDLSSAYHNKTGGSDGQPQSLNDRGQLAIRLEFTDGSHGVFVLRLDWPGDGDGDGDVDLWDAARFQECYGGPGFPVDPEVCGKMDLDEDQDVDISDFVLFEGMMTGCR